MFQIFKDANFDFMRMRRFWVGLSFTLMVLSIIAIVTKGIHWGIEFKGGAEVQVRYAARPDVGAVREQLTRANFPAAVVTTIGKPEENQIYIRVPLVEGAKDNDVAAQVVKALQAASGGQGLTVLSQSYMNGIRTSRSERSCASVRRRLVEPGCPETRTRSPSFAPSLLQRRYSGERMGLFV